MIQKPWFAIALVTGIALGLAATGCGTGNEPLSILGDPNQVLQFGLPLQSPCTQIYSITAFNTSASPSVDGFEFNSATISGGLPVFAPANGIVSSTDATSVTIFHNTHLSSRISKLAAVTIQPGAFVSTSSQLGITPTATTTFILLRFSILVDGNAVCPYSFLSTDARAQVTLARLGTTIPCLQ